MQRRFAARMVLAEMLFIQVNLRICRLLGRLTSVLTELMSSWFRLDVDLFAKHRNGGDTDVCLGVGFFSIIGNF